MHRIRTHSKAKVRSSGVYLAEIIGDAWADPSDFVGGVGVRSWEGLFPPSPEEKSGKEAQSPVKWDFSVKMARFGEI